MKQNCNCPQLFGSDGVTLRNVFVGFWGCGGFVSPSNFIVGGFLFTFFGFVFSGRFFCLLMFIWFNNSFK